MEVIYHPLVKRDVAEALKYYTEISTRLADEFQSEVRELISQAADNPLRFHPTQRGFRRANLRRFPYQLRRRHILVRVLMSPLTRLGSFSVAELQRCQP